MAFAYGLYKTSEPLLDLFRCGVGECVEYECVGFGVGGYVREILVELALPRQPYVDCLHAQGPSESCRIGQHSAHISANRSKGDRQLRP